MTETLQRKFVVTAMIAISALLLVLIGAINAANFAMLSRQTDRMLSELAETEGQYVPPAEPHRGTAPDLPGPPSADDMMGARYFLVYLDWEGKVVRTDVRHIYAVLDAEAEDYARRAVEKGGSSGRTGNFSYRISPSRDGRGSLAVFLDTSMQNRSSLNVLLVSLSVGLLCWTLMLLLVILLSRRAIAPVARSIKKQKQFVTNAGHELKTPLAIIMANTEAMELYNGENKWSRNIREQTERLGGLMQNLLTLAKLDENGDSLPLSPLSADAMLRETLDFYSEMAEAKNIRIQSDIQSEVSLLGSYAELSQLFSVLMDNAIKYSPGGEDVSVSLKKSGGRAVLQVRNTCETPPEGELERLFDRFYRGDAARTQKNGGCGVGLSAARSIVKALGGSIYASLENGDIIFTVKI